YYPETLRLVRYWDQEQEREFTFLTNATQISALQVAELYKNRWQVELFFKWLKQHLKIKKFWGTTENAVRMSISEIWGQGFRSMLGQRFRRILGHFPSAIIVD